MKKQKNKFQRDFFSEQNTKDKIEKAKANPVKVYISATFSLTTMSEKIRG